MTSSCYFLCEYKTQMQKREFLNISEIQKIIIFQKMNIKFVFLMVILVGIDTSFVAVKFAIFEEKNQGSKKCQKNTIFQDLNNLHFVD